MEKKYLLAIFSIILLVLTIYLFYENTNLLKLIENKSIALNATLSDLAKAKDTISSLNLDLSKKNTELNDAKQRIVTILNLLNSTENELTNIRTELAKTTETLEKTRLDLSDLRWELNEIQLSLNSSIQWFKDNSFIPSSLNNAKNSITNTCVKDNVLKLACIPYLLALQYDINYKSEESDKLYSISEMFDRGGGDCEDYSLFSKALLNSLKKDKNNFKLEAWIDGNNKYVFYETANSYLYYDADPKSLGYVQDLNYYVICYNADNSGHCLLALSENNISSIKDIALLNNAQTFEPQNGEYLGKIGKDFYICEQGEEDCKEKINKIYFIIADTDLYQFEYNQWTSYAFYQEYCSSIRQNVSNILNSQKEY